VTRHRRLIGKQVAGGERVNHVHELPREYAYDAAAKGRSALRQWYDGLADAQRIVLRPIVAKLRSAADASDEEAEQQRQAKNELVGRAADEQRTQRSIQRAPPRAERVRRSVRLQQHGLARRANPQDMRRRRELGRHVADMLAVIANLTDPADTAMSERFKRDNREMLEQMRQAKRDAWSTIEHRLGDSRPRIARAAEMKDETVTLSRIIADCLQSQYRYLADAADVGPHDFCKRVAQEVMDRLQSPGIDVVSR
jgi:hypothetical protein